MGDEGHLSARIRQFIRSNILGLIAIYLALGGIAAANHGAPNSISSVDIINGEVKSDDLAMNAVGTAKINDRSVKNADLSIGASSSNTIADGGIESIDVKNDTLTDADIDNSAQFNGASAAGDLAGTYPNPTIANGAVAGGAGGEIADDTITGADVDESTLNGIPLTGPAGGDLAGTYPNPTIATGAVGSAAVNDNSLTGADVADTNSLTGAEILETTLAVGGDLTGSVANAALAANAITGAEVADGSLAAADLASDSVALSELDISAVFHPDEFRVNAGTAQVELDNDAVQSPEVTDNTLTGSDVDESMLGTVPNASTLDGIDSSALVVGDSSTADTGECTGNLPTDFETCADVAVTFPHNGRALVLATAAWEVTHHEGGFVDPHIYSTCQIQVDESNTLVDQTVGDASGDTHFAEVAQESVAMQALTGSLPGGDHLFEFNCKDHVTGPDPPIDTDIDDAYISVIVIGSGAA